MLSERRNRLSANAVPEWIQTLSSARGRFAAALRDSDQEPANGYRHTIREICQQPATWAETARRMAEFIDALRPQVQRSRRILLTGSGSSQYAGECVAQALSEELHLPVEVQGGGALLLGGGASIAGEPALVVSLARSGNSPESAAVVQKLLDTEPNTEHLVLTCNAEGRLAQEFAGNPRVKVIALSDDVHDRSLVMTSSFTNLALSARALGWLEQGDAYIAKADGLDLAARRLLTQWPDRIGEFSSGEIRRTVFLGTGCRLGSARESALKMLEMTAGKVATMAETYLGLRHGPMSFVNRETLLVCFLSSDSLIRAYERDLIAELNAKGLGARKLIAGTGDPGSGLCKGSDLAIPYELPGDSDDASLTLLDAMIGQILGFHRCREEGLRPDSPSESGVISRVVGEFQIHAPEGTRQ